MLANTGGAPQAASSRVTATIRISFFMLFLQVVFGVMVRRIRFFRLQEPLGGNY